MVLHNPNNWHWVNKDVKDWALEYLEKSLVGTSAQEGDVSAKVSRIMSMDGDVDVSQRKGKVITLFDVKLQMEYEGDEVLQFVWGCWLTGSRRDKRCRGRQWNNHSAGGSSRYRGR